MTHTARPLAGPVGPARRARRRTAGRPGGDCVLIVVATDGSDAAGVGVELVASGTWPAGTTVRVVQAVDPLPMTLAEPYGMVGAGAPDAELEAAAAAHLEAA